MSEKDIVEEAREMADDHRYDIQPSVRATLRALADEVERLRREIKVAELTVEGLLNRLGSRNED